MAPPVDMISVYMTDEGPKKLTDMTREELIAALEETGQALEYERRMARETLDLFAGIIKRVL